MRSLAVHQALSNLRRFRLARRVSQAALAKEAGLTQAGISQIERGLRVPTLRTFTRMVEALGVGIERLWDSPECRSLSREQVDRIARQIVSAKSSVLDREEKELADAVGLLVIQKLRAHRRSGRVQYSRFRWKVARRGQFIREQYGAGVVDQILKRVDALLAMGEQR